MTDPGEVSILAELAYLDPAGALDWLAAAFGFATRIVVRDSAGEVVFAETGLGGRTVAIVPARGDGPRSPRELGGANTQSIQLRMTADVDRHCAVARAAGALILMEPETVFFGDRMYRAADLEGHVWTFSQRIPGAGGSPPDGWSVAFPDQAGGS
jgi:uncharacterized glyoxalase superfamily protein PhnB